MHGHHTDQVRSRLIYRPAIGRLPDGRKSFSWRDHRDLLIAAHVQLPGPLVLIWESLGTHLAKGMRELVEARDWLTVCQVPSYRPELIDVEEIWSLLRRRPADTAFTDPGRLITAVRRALREIQHQHFEAQGRPAQGAAAGRVSFGRVDDRAGRRRRSVVGVR